ncbi:hypothetical protein GCM10027614_68710 [Micromonospora vulcania]
MTPGRRLGGTLTVLLSALLTATACGPVADRKPQDLRVGYDSLDGSLTVWPPRGDLAGDATVTAAVTVAVRDWRSPADDRAHLPSSGILWSGRVDGTPVALVAADVPGESSSWLLQLTRNGDRYAVSRATEYTDPGYLVYSDVLPVQTANGRRYLVSARVQQLLGPEGRALNVADGLTVPVAVPACTAVGVTATLRATESLPWGVPPTDCSTWAPAQPIRAIRWYATSPARAGGHSPAWTPACWPASGARSAASRVESATGTRHARCPRPGRWRNSPSGRSARWPSVAASRPSCNN